MLLNSIAMPMMIKRMLGNEIPEFLQIFRRDAFGLAGEIERFVHLATMLRQKHLLFSVCGICKNRVTSCPLLRVVLGLRLERLFLMARAMPFVIDLMEIMMRFV